MIVSDVQKYDNFVIVYNTSVLIANIISQFAVESTSPEAELQSY